MYFLKINYSSQLLYVHIITVYLTLFKVYFENARGWELGFLTFFSLLCENHKYLSYELSRPPNITGISALAPLFEITWLGGKIRIISKQSLNKRKSRKM